MNAKELHREIVGTDPPDLKPASREDFTESTNVWDHVDSTPTSPPELRILDGVPRYAHKTTSAIKEAAKTPNQKLYIGLNHTLCEENIKEKLTVGKYAVGAESVVHVKGKDRSCPGCDHELNGENYFKFRNAGQEALKRHRHVDPDVFSDVCPYYATLFAAEYADWIVTVPEMYVRLKNRITDSYDVIVDEESTLDYWLPKSATVCKLKKSEGLFDEQWDVKEWGFNEKGIDYIQSRIDAKTDDMDRVPSRYKHINRALTRFSEIGEDLRDQLAEIRRQEDVIEAIEDIPIEEIETASKHEINATYEILRNQFSRSATASALEPLLFEPRLTAAYSGDEVHIRIVANPFAGHLINGELFTEAEHVWLVGNYTAKYIAGHFHYAPERCYEDLTPPNIDDLEIIAVEGEDEFARRGAMTRVAKELTAAGRKNLLIAGSGRRAANVHDQIHPDSYFFKGNSRLEHYDVAASAGWNVTSYMGSRLTRGVDVDTQVTIVRSEQFATPRWDYFNQNESEFGVAVKMRRYENQIEGHNAFLRGAAQGEKHVGVIPASLVLLWDLDYTVMGTDVSAIVKHILDFLTDGQPIKTCDCGVVYLDGHQCVFGSADH